MESAAEPRNGTGRAREATADRRCNRDVVILTAKTPRRRAADRAASVAVVISMGCHAVYTAAGAERETGGSNGVACGMTPVARLHRQLR